MRPDGPKSASVYLLLTNPNEDDDDSGVPLSGRMGDEIYNKFGTDFIDRDVRVGYVTQCRGDQTLVEIECCRNRVISDIEATKPVVVVTVGDAPLHWATGISGNAKVHRGTPIVAKIGRHVCWVFPMMYPNYLHKKQKFGKSEYELTFAHDARALQAFIEGWTEPTFQTAPYDDGVEIITGSAPGDMQRLELALKELAREADSAADIETNGLRPYMLRDPHIWTCAVGTFKRTVAFPVDHPDGWSTELQRKQVWSLLGNYLLNSGRKACHHLGMEHEWFAYFFGGPLLRKTEWHDTMAMAHTFDERPGTKALGTQTHIHFGFDLKAQSNIDPKRLLEYPLKDVLRYNGMDAKWTDGLRRLLLPRLEADPVNLAEYQRKVRLAPTLVLTEAVGLLVDFPYAEKHAKALDQEATKLEKQIARCPEVKQYASRFGTFSPTNPDHVLKLLDKICERDEIRVYDDREKTTRMTTDEEAISKIPGEEVASVPLILEHREISKLSSTYVQPIITGKIVCPDGRVRPKYGSMVAVTGRLNSEDPNIQNWPARKHKDIRGIICAPKGYWMVPFDYGQIEFRVVGMASEDKNLVKYCWTGYDVHKYWAERMINMHPQIKDRIVATFKIDWDEKGLKTLRQEAKNMWVFPQLFGSSVRSCAEQLHLPDDVADSLAAEFWDEFSGVKRWQENLIKSYERNLYVETLGGRKRRGPMTKNELINQPIQGTAADIVLEAMCVLSERAMNEDDPDFQPVFNGHDDLTFYLPGGTMETKIEMIVREMCKPRFNYINVPLVVEVKAGPNWFDTQELKVYRSHELFNTPNPYR